MSFRAKCPTCGRKQPAELSEAGHLIFCAACGTRFLVEHFELVEDNATIPDVDFFPTVPTIPDTTAPIALPQTPQPMIEVPPDTQPAHETPAELAPQPDAPLAPRSNLLVPLIVSGVLVVCLTLALGIVVGYMLFRQPAQYAQDSSSAKPTVVQAPVPVSKPVATSLLPATKPVEAAQPIEPEPQPTPTPVAPVKPAPVAEEIPAPPPVPAKFRPVHPAIGAEDLDDHIGNSINTGVSFLLSQFANGRLKRYDPHNPPTAGMDALAVYSLLHAAEATHDLRLLPDSPQVAQMLDELKKMPMDHEVSTYSRSLRAAALGVYHRHEDKAALEADCKWLIADSHNGAYTYEPSNENNRRLPARMAGMWDNSNSQYGALGVWAALEAGVEVPNAYWRDVQKHWLDCQLPDGEWAYTGYGAIGRLSMTVAGITTLLVTEDQLDAQEVVKNLGHQPYTPALTRGLNWLEAGDNAVRLPNNWRTYNLFGLERAALASGYKYFGDHDWYRELASDQLGRQQPDGSWLGFDPIVDTSYTLLFLSRGRHPIFMNKLRFDGYWANRPRDIANLAHFTGGVLERPLNWQVVSLKNDWSDWMDSPVLFIASHEGLKLSDEEVGKLRAFSENGGLIFTHADGGMPAFNKSIAEIAKRLFPQYALTDLPATHPIYSSEYKIKLAPKLQGISNGSRLLLVHSPTDLNKVWQLRDAVMSPTDFQMGINIFIYAAGKANLRNRLKTPLVPDPQVNPILTTTIARVRHLGDWDPEPAALPRFARLFLGQTSVKVNVVDADPQTLDPLKMPLAHLTGTALVHFTPVECRAIHDYVDNGGTLLIDACGGSAEFNKSMVGDFLPHAFPKSLMADMQSDNPILQGKSPGMIPVPLKLRPWRKDTDGATNQPIQFLTLGKGMVIYSTVDLSTALLGTNTYPVNGYDPDTAYDLTQNILLSILER